MHPNPAFRQEEKDRNLSFARSRGFGILALNADPAPVLAHVPFLINDDGTCADLHLVRSNPITKLAPAAAVIAVSGPDGYVSPDWYDTADQVPTWNYIAVHLRGHLTPLPNDQLKPLLDRQTAAYEAQIDKQPWTTGKMTAGVMDRMMRQILPFRFQIETIEGTWKLNQNKPDAARQSAARSIETGLGQELTELAQHMKNV